MLDDFGLQAALEWHVRDFTGRYGVDVGLTIDGTFEGLPDRHRTCVYRAIQEALTNCVRHAHASAITINVIGRADRLVASITDNGIGLDPTRPRSGLGLRGIEERVKELNGAMTIGKAKGGGTTLAISLPVPASMEDAPLARVAG